MCGFGDEKVVFHERYIHETRAYHPESDDWCEPPRVLLAKAHLATI